MLRGLTLVLALSLMTACHPAPPNLTPNGQRLWVANEAVVAINTVQHAAIGLNAIKVCPQPTVCMPLLSDSNTRIVVDIVENALRTTASVPNGWKATMNTALDLIGQRLDARGKDQLKAYVDAAKIIINGGVQ